ncbi:peroxisome biogenesis protein 1 [Dorcoceras hygrometricum]|uniref:Peroxisome biogenesis protein 1 n=1 Tax=Dorcoceras hygrometricum TaxID=472368 RepID=A0A2Z6ZXE1_9LAMI|nr:peroxisome biogenesis protein 1 [Dorcoceras hygrometricum]
MRAAARLDVGRLRANRCAIGKRRCALDGRTPLRKERAALAETLRDGWPVVVRYVAHGFTDGWRNHWSDVDARWPRDGQAVARGRASRLARVARAAAASFSCGGGAAAGRRSGESPAMS